MMKTSLLLLLLLLTMTLDTSDERFGYIVRQQNREFTGLIGESLHGRAASVLLRAQPAQREASMNKVKVSPFSMGATLGIGSPAATHPTEASPGSGAKTNPSHKRAFPHRRRRSGPGPVFSETTSEVI